MHRMSGEPYLESSLTVDACRPRWVVATSCLAVLLLSGVVSYCFTHVAVLMHDIVQRSHQSWQQERQRDQQPAE